MMQKKWMTRDEAEIFWPSSYRDDCQFIFIENAILAFSKEFGNNDIVDFSKINIKQFHDFIDQFMEKHKLN